MAIENRSGLELTYRLCDVFTSTAFEGNQLAVFEDAGELTDAEMQALAREMNLSETTFILPREEAVERERGVRVRIFTTQEELPFAGHPTLGTAAILHSFFPRYAGTQEIVLELNAGRVPVHFDPRRGSERAPFALMTQPKPAFGALHPPAAVAAAIGLSEADIASGAALQTVSTGMPFCIVPLRSLEALGRLRVPQREAAAYLACTDAKFFYCIAPDANPTQWRARMQFYNGEDPATGSAAGCAIAYLVRQRLVDSGCEVHLRQGIEMKRPSDLFLSAARVHGEVVDVKVGGSTVSVAKGRVFLERCT